MRAPHLRPFGGVMRLHVFVSLFLFLMWAFAAPTPPALAQGQAIDGIIEGVVRTQADGTAAAPAPPCAPSMPAPATSARWSATTSGRYGLPLLPPGEYVVFVEAPSFATMSQDRHRAARRPDADRRVRDVDVGVRRDRAGDRRAVDRGSRPHRAEQHLRRTHRARDSDDRPQHPRLLRPAARASTRRRSRAAVRAPARRAPSTAASACAR